MLTKSQIKYLQNLSHNYKASIQIGKNGITDSTFRSIEENLLANELVKVRILNNCGLEAKAISKEIAEYFDAEFISALGKIFVIYKKNEKQPIIKLPN